MPLWRAILLGILVVVLGFRLGYARNTVRTSIEYDFSAKAIALPAQGMWRFEYPGSDGALGTGDDVFSERLLYLPADTICALRVSTVDACASFYVPAARAKSPVVTPGAQEVLVLDHRGTRGERATFYCAEFCGDLHTRMTGDLVYLGRERFEFIMGTLPRVAR